MTLSEEKKVNVRKLMEDHAVVEGFCGACLAIPLAFAGVGASAYGASSSRGAYKKRKKIILWSGIITTLVAVAIAIYYMTACTKCR